VKLLHGELVERVLRWCAVGFSIAAFVCGVASIMSGSSDVVFSASLIVAAVVFALAVYVCIAALGFMAVYGRVRKRDHPIA
jgi:hypothetical protein